MAIRQRVRLRNGPQPRAEGAAQPSELSSTFHPARDARRTTPLVASQAKFYARRDARRHLEEGRPL